MKTLYKLKIPGLALALTLNLTAWGRTNGAKQSLTYKQRFPSTIWAKPKAEERPKVAHRRPRAAAPRSRSCKLLKAFFKCSKRGAGPIHRRYISQNGCGDGCS